jgi:hypothetical protein
MIQGNIVVDFRHSLLCAQVEESLIEAPKVLAGIKVHPFHRTAQSFVYVLNASQAVVSEGTAEFVSLNLAGKSFHGLKNHYFFSFKSDESILLQIVMSDLCFIYCA